MMATSYWHRFKQLVVVPQEQFVSEGHQWSNHDLDPTPPAERKWSAWVYAAFWSAHAMNASAWTAGSATVSTGLKWWQAWIALNVAHIIGTFMVVANGRMAARYHIGFPVCSRASWGMWGSYMAVIMRAVVCVVWNGTNTFYAGRLVDVCIQCIWPSWTDVKNTLPVSQGITTRQLVSFIIAWFIFQCLTVIHPRDLRVFYVVKSVIVFAAMHGVLIWWMVKNHGASFPRVETSLSTSETGWLFMSAFNAGFGTISSLTVNQADIARYAKKPDDQFWGQILVFPVASALPGLYGVLVASASKEMFGQPAWNLWDVMQLMLDQYPNSPGARFGIFLASGSMALALIAVNLATNCLPFGSDVAAMFPRYMTIRRGQFLCCMLGMAIVPWKILKDGASFLAFLTGYGYWLAPGAAILCIDYFVVQNGNIVINDLYLSGEQGMYWYTKGWNLRAPVVTILSLIPCLPGFIHTVAHTAINIPEGALHLNKFSFLLTYIVAGILYWTSYKIWPRNTERCIDTYFEAVADDNDREERGGRGDDGGEDGSTTSKSETTFRERSRVASEGASHRKDSSDS